MWQAFVETLCAFFGVRRSSTESAATTNPKQRWLALLIAAFVSLLVFVIGLIAFVHWITASHSFY